MLSVLVLLAGPFLFGYLLGSIPFGLLVTRAAGLGDIRKVGSGNIGATNVLRTGRKSLAAATLALDALKGFAAVLLVTPLGQVAAIGAALGAVIGHMFPVWLSFRGGKGMATAIGIMWGLYWPLGAVACITWLVIAAVFRYSSLASLSGVAAATLAAWILVEKWTALALTVVMVLVWIRHHENIRRLLAGNEAKIGEGKKSAA